MEVGWNTCCYTEVEAYETGGNQERRVVVASILLEVEAVKSNF